MAKAAAQRKQTLASPGHARIRVERGLDREIELKLKLRAQDVAALRARLDRLAASRSEHIDSLYFDTPDHRLASAQAALRLRSIGKGRSRRWVQTVKTQLTEAALCVRGEWERPAPGGRIDWQSLAQSPLMQVLGGDTAHGGAQTSDTLAQLRPVFQTVFDRTAWDLVLDGAHLEAVIDLGEIRAEDRVEAICEAELELLAGPQQALVDMALQLAGAIGRHRADLCLLPYGMSKAARGYRLALGRGPVPFAANFATAHRFFTPQQRVAEAARRLVDIGMTTVLANAADFSPAADSELVHQARVAMRRMRTGLDVLGSGAELPAELLHGLRIWARRFGVVRDWDVLCGDHLPPLASAASGSDVAVWKRLFATAIRRRDAARQALWRQLQTAAFAEFALRALRWTGSDPAKSGKRLDSFARKVLRSRQRRLVAAARSFSELPLKRQHKARIQAKGLRYGIEMLQSSLPKKARRVGLPALARFQDAAGVARDALFVQALVERLTRSAAVRRQVGDWAKAQHAAAIVKAQRLAADLKDLF